MGGDNGILASVMGISVGVMGIPVLARRRAPILPLPSCAVAMENLYPQGVNFFSTGSGPDAAMLLGTIPGTHVLHRQLFHRHVFAFLAFLILARAILSRNCYECCC